MKIEIKKSFLKDIKKQKNYKLEKKVKELLLSLQTKDDITQIENLRKLSGFKNFYRIRLGDYRIGVYFENEILYIVRCLHRKEIYKFFP
jgi:mRNA interferase RelE/StbE